MKCIDSCKTCDNSTRCIECTTGYSLHNNGASCLATCPAGTYKGTVAEKSTCIPCTDTLQNCGKCSQGSTCDECSGDYYLIEDTLRCAQTCPDRYSVVSTPIKRCTLCIPNCVKCASKTECAVCADGYYLENKTCNKCKEECGTCESGRQCRTCNSSFYLLENESERKCLKECPSFYYEDSTSPLSCKPCQENCELCSNPSTCNGCKSGYYLNAQGSCLKCPSICEECARVGSKVSCTVCADGTFMFKEECIDS